MLPSCFSNCPFHFDSYLCLMSQATDQTPLALTLKCVYLSTTFLLTSSATNPVWTAAISYLLNYSNLPGSLSLALLPVLFCILFDAAIKATHWALAKAWNSSDASFRAQQKWNPSCTALVLPIRLPVPLWPCWTFLLLYSTHPHLGLCFLEINIYIYYH